MTGIEGPGLWLSWMDKLFNVWQGVSKSISSVLLTTTQQWQFCKIAATGCNFRSEPLSLSVILFGSWFHGSVIHDFFLPELGVILWNIVPGLPCKQKQVCNHWCFRYGFISTYPESEGRILRFAFQKRWKPQHKNYGTVRLYQRTHNMCQTADSNGEWRSEVISSEEGRFLWNGPLGQEKNTI